MNYVVFWVAAGLFFIRFPRGLRNPIARPALAASCFAIIGVATVGVAWPVELLDDLIGGVNAIDLIQALAATGGFWYLRAAIRIYSGRRAASPTALLVTILVAEAISFAVIPDHTGQALTYIHDHLYLPAVWIHITIYLVSIGWLALSSLLTLLPHRAGAGWLFVGGFALIVLAVALELIDVTSVFVLGHQTAFSLLMLNLFNALFYPGLCAIGAGYAWHAVPREIATLRWRIDVLHMCFIARRDRRHRTKLFWRDDAEFAAYRMHIEVQDRVIAGHIELSPREKAYLDRVDHRLMAGVPTWA